MTQQLELQLFEMPDGTHQLNVISSEAGIRMGAEDVTSFIAGLSRERVEMLPPVSTTPPPIANMPNVADDPVMRWAYDEMNDRAALVIRHPGYGWIGYSLLPETAEALRLGLQQIADHRNAQRRSPN